jgi:hypothetical protein
MLTIQNIPKWNMSMAIKTWVYSKRPNATMSVKDISDGGDYDLVVMDDFFYSEPGTSN